MGLIIQLHTLSNFVWIFLKIKPTSPTNSINWKSLPVSAGVHNACKDVMILFELAEYENRWYWSPVSVHRQQ